VVGPRVFVEECGGGCIALHSRVHLLPEAACCQVDWSQQVLQSQHFVFGVNWTCLLQSFQASSRQTLLSTVSQVDVLDSGRQPHCIFQLRHCSDRLGPKHTLRLCSSIRTAYSWCSTSSSSGRNRLRAAVSSERNQGGRRASSFVHVSTFVLIILCCIAQRLRRTVTRIPPPIFLYYPARLDFTGTFRLPQSGV
jgi:hypothetical protein